MYCFRGFAPRQPIYFRRQSAANSFQIRHVFCFGAYSRAQSPGIANRAQCIMHSAILNIHIYRLICVTSQLGKSLVKVILCLEGVSGHVYNTSCNFTFSVQN